MNQIDYRKNGLDFVRYYAALSVMTLHFSGLYMIYCDNSNNRIADFFRSVSLSIPGVVVFFAISGFFAMASLEKAYESNPDCPIKYFVTKKLVRIFPEYWLCTFINAVVIIILAYDKLDKSFALWLGTQLFGIANTPSCLKGFATGSVNGPLWTVFVQIQIYVVIALTYKWLQKMSKVGWGIIILLSIVANGLCEYIANAFDESIVSKLIERSVVPYFLWAILGAFIFRYIDMIIPVLKRTWWILLVILLIFGRLTYLKETVATYGYYTSILIGIFHTVCYYWMCLFTTFQACQRYFVQHIFVPVDSDKYYNSFQFI